MKKTTYIIILIALSINLFGQESSFPIPNQTGNSIVNLSTGAPFIKIPLWTATSGNISLPISLVYSTNGVRYNELPSEVGLSWKLIAGGSITQVVRDTSRNNAGSIETYYDYFPTEYEIEYPSNDFFSEIVQSNWDVEPDIYIVNVPGYSGEFFIAEIEDEIKYIPLVKSDIIIEPIAGNEYDECEWGFKITLENGTQYFFERNITTYYFDDYTVAYQKKWLLTKIKSANNTDEIILNYSQKYEPNDFICYGEPALGYTEINGVNESQYTKKIVQEEIFLESIVTNNETINFKIEDTDLYTAENSPYKAVEKETDVNFNNIDELLKDITIYDINNNLMKKIHFSYISTAGSNRILLESVREEYSNNNFLPPYVFSYKGFFPISYYLHPAGERCINPPIYDFWFFNKSFGGSHTDYETHFPHEEYCSMGMLQEIHYPTGSYTKYIYEPNYYKFDTDTNSVWYNANWNNVLDNYDGTIDKDTIQGPGVRVLKVITKKNINDNPHITEYGYHDEYDISSSGRLTSYPLLHYEDDTYNTTIRSSNNFGIEGGYLIYNKITEYKGGQQTIENEGEEPIKINKGINGKIEYIFSVNPPEEVPGGDLPYSIYIINKNYNGLLEKKIVYDDENKEKTYTENTYSTDTTGISSPGLIVLQCTQNNSIYYNKTYHIRQKKIQLLQTINKSYDENENFIENITDYTYNYNDRLEEIKQTNSFDEDILTKLFYRSDINDNVGNLMKDRNILSVVYKKEIFKGGVQLSGTNTIYELSEDSLLILPAETQIYEDDELVTKVWYDKYDDNANLLQSHGIDNVYSSVILGYNNTMPIATVTNAQVDEIFHDDFEESAWWKEGIGYFELSSDYYTGQKSMIVNSTFAYKTIASNKLQSNKEYIFSAMVKSNSGYKIKAEVHNPNNGTTNFETETSTSENWQYVEIPFSVLENYDHVNIYLIAYDGDAYFDNVRVFPADAYMTTTTYTPLIGTTSITDANNNSIYLEYDDFGRQTTIKNFDKVTINQTEYHFLQYPDFDFEIEGPLQADPHETITLEIDDGQPPSDGSFQIWTWYDNSFEIIGYGSSIDVEVESGNNVFYCRKYTDGFYSKYREYAVYVEDAD